MFRICTTAIGQKSTHGDTGGLRRPLGAHEVFFPLTQIPVSQETSGPALRVGFYVDHDVTDTDIAMKNSSDFPCVLMSCRLSLLVSGNKGRT